MNIKVGYGKDVSSRRAADCLSATLCEKDAEIEKLKDWQKRAVVALDAISGYADDVGFYEEVMQLLKEAEGE